MFRRIIGNAHISVIEPVEYSENAEIHPVGFKAYTLLLFECLNCSVKSISGED
jgi:hypothetical protein